MSDEVMKTGIHVLVEEKRRLEKELAELITAFEKRSNTRVTAIRVDEIYRQLGDARLTTRCFIDLELDPDDQY